MGKAGRKRRGRKNRGRLGVFLILALLVAASLVFFEILFDQPLQRKVSRFTETKALKSPCLALIIDDGGYHLDLLKEMLRLGRPITFAILPNTPHTREAAVLVHQNGGEAMLHLPMEPKEGGPYARERDMITGDMPSPSIQKILRTDLSQIPNVRGVNNHMGSKATEDRRVMDAVMGVLKEEGLYYIDSHTSPHSLSREAARSGGVLFAQNDKFMDAMKTPEAVKEALRLAMAQAKKEGRAVAIGHLDPLTCRVLQEMIPEIERAGIRLVFASEVVG